MNNHRNRHPLAVAVAIAVTVLATAIAGCASSSPPDPGAESMATNASPASASEANRIVVRRFYEEFLNHERRDLLPTLVAASFVDHTSGAQGLAGLQAGADNLHRAFEGLRFQVEDIAADGDLVAVRWVYTGRNVAPFFGQPATGLTREQHGINFFRLQGGRIAELWLAVDPKSLRPQPVAR